MSATPVPAPPAEAPRFGLLASVDPNPDNSAFRWQTGITYAPEGCSDGEVLTDLCDPADLASQTKPDTVTWYPYTLKVEETCTVASSASNDEAIAETRARVERLLNQSTETLIGSELWSGAYAQSGTIPGTATDLPNVWLADVANVDILTESGPVGFVHALACLEQYLADNNGGKQGMIHATPQIVTHWESFRLLRREGNRILTFKDTIVVPSPGYAGTSPDGTIGDNNIWAYATDKIRIWLERDPRITAFPSISSIDRLQNTTTIVAQRLALAEWERCRHAGVRIAASVCDQGGS